MFQLVWTAQAQRDYERQREAAQAGTEKSRRKPAKVSGLFRQVHKTLTLLQGNPRHPGLQTHEYRTLMHPYDPAQKLFEAYEQNKTRGAYRVFWCYGPENKQITVLAITPHP